MFHSALQQSSLLLRLCSVVTPSVMPICFHKSKLAQAGCHILWIRYGVVFITIPKGIIAHIAIHIMLKEGYNYREEPRNRCSRCFV
jgi:hypothetical protein